MGVGARMGGATDGNAPVINLHLIGSSTAEKWQGLKRLERRANETFHTGMPRRHQHPTSAITNHRMDAMH
jgi:hypothetical protein